MFTVDDLRARIDEEAQSYRTDPDLTYEAAVGITSACGWALTIPEIGQAARTLNQTFGAWAHQIHSHGGGGTKEAALAAHDSIARALEHWLAGGREDVLAFATRWQLADGADGTAAQDEHDPTQPGGS